jgi:hypothetical protein
MRLRFDPVVRLPETTRSLLNAVFAGEARDGAHFVARGHVLAIDVLGEGFFEGFMIGQLAHDDRSL